MENSSIPSSTRATGRISTPWSKPLKQRNKAGIRRDGALRRPLRGRDLGDSHDPAPAPDHDYDYDYDYDRSSGTGVGRSRLRLRLRLRARARTGREFDQDHE